MTTTAKIEKRIGVQASPERIWEVLSDLSAWGRWNPHETNLEGAIAFGGRVSLDEAFPDLPARRVEARIGEWEPGGQLVWLENRGWLFRSIRYYEIEKLGSESCIVANGVIFQGLRGELFHDKHRARIRTALDVIGERLKLAAES